MGIALKVFDEGKMRIKKICELFEIDRNWCGVCRHEIFAHINKALSERAAIYDRAFLAYLVAIPRHSLNF